MEGNGSDVAFRLSYVLAEDLTAGSFDGAVRALESSARERVDTYPTP
jgi:hypothetical protein